MRRLVVPLRGARLGHGWHGWALGSSHAPFYFPPSRHPANPRLIRLRRVNGWGHTAERDASDHRHQCPRLHRTYRSPMDNKRRRGRSRSDHYGTRRPRSVHNPGGPNLPSIPSARDGREDGEWLHPGRLRERPRPRRQAHGHRRVRTPDGTAGARIQGAGLLRPIPRYPRWSSPPHRPRIPRPWPCR